MVKKIQIPKDNNIQEVSIEDAMPQNYLPYAVEVSKDRALPDVRDGLKPVQRRILYGAYILKALPDKPYLKSARIVGDILGKFHPHGDSSVYDAMVILAQDFSTRYPLIDGHGNWGSQDGDGAAAMRYTEARLTPIALEMMKDIDKDVVNMVDNYSQTEVEPEVLPSRFPNILVNGAFGIAVGLATNIPPHNLSEVIDGLIAYVDNNDITTEELMKYIKGPDLPTGGTIIGSNSLLKAYKTGVGRVALRAKANVEILENKRYGIVISEFPYRKNKAKLLQTISEMTADKKHSKMLDSISDIRDESDRNGIRAVIEFKKSTNRENVEKVLKYLYKKTELQCNINFNMVALADGKPKTLSLKQILKYYLQHQKNVITRRTKKELEIAKKRFHIVEGFIKAIDIMDEIIATIRASKSKKDSEKNIVKKFGFTQIQAQAIVELMLYKLTGLEIKVFQKEYKELSRKIKKLSNILEDENVLYKVLKSELKEIKDKYGDERKTNIINNDEEAKIEVDEILIDEDCVVTMSNEGYIKRISKKSYNRLNSGVEDIEYREGDYNKYLIDTNTKHYIVLFTDQGNMYKIKVIDIPELKWKEKGERVDILIHGIKLDEENIIFATSIEKFDVLDYNIIFVTNKGKIKRTYLNNLKTNYTKIQALKLELHEKLIYVDILKDVFKYMYASVSTVKGLNYIEKVPLIDITGKNIKSVKAIKLFCDDEISSISFLNEREEKEVVFNINVKGDIKISKNELKDFKNIRTHSFNKLLIFDNCGNVYNIPVNMIENLSGKINLSCICKEFVKDSEITNVISIEENKEIIGDVYTVTKFGYIRKTRLCEYIGNSYCESNYNLKAGDSVVSVEVSYNDMDVILATQKGMVIRFNSSSINYMSKNAKGVCAIKLEKDDFVVFSKMINSKNNKAKYNLFEIAVSKDDVDASSIIFTTNKNNTQAIMTCDIKVQNRAGKGKKLIPLSQGEYITHGRLNED